MLGRRLLHSRSQPRREDGRNGHRHRPLHRNQGQLGRKMAENGGKFTMALLEGILQVTLEWVTDLELGELA
jgi:hypothetical protein